MTRNQENEELRNRMSRLNNMFLERSAEIVSKAGFDVQPPEEFILSALKELPSFNLIEIEENGRGSAVYPEPISQFIDLKELNIDDWQEVGFSRMELSKVILKVNGPLTQIDFTLLSQIRIYTKQIVLVQKLTREAKFELAEIRHSIRASLAGTLMHLETAKDYMNAGRVSQISHPGSKMSAYDAGLRKSIYSALHSSSNLIDNLDSAKLFSVANSVQDLKISKIDLGVLIADSTERLKVEAKRRGIYFKIDLKALVSDPHPMGDKLLFNLMVTNLIDNAVKYSIRDQEIGIVLSFSDRCWTLSIKNMGLYLTQAEQKKIFEARYQGDRAEFKTGLGSGLGLTVVKNVLDLHKPFGISMVLNSELIDLKNKFGSTSVTLKFPIVNPELS